MAIDESVIRQHASGILRFTSETAIEQNLAAAEAAAGEEHRAAFLQLNYPPTDAAPVVPSDPSTWYLEPAQVFDNLYFLGATNTTAWALNTSDGIILFDGLYDYQVREEVDAGLLSLGLDPADIKYVVVTHGHRDHDEGARHLQETYGARVILSEEDWNLLESADRTKPERDLVGTDGQKLTLGDTTVTLYATPGHTLGTQSFVFEVKDGGETHKAALWGGTAFNFQPSVERFELYSGSADRFGDIADAADVEVILSNHITYDRSLEKIAALESRGPGDPHPYVVGEDAVLAFLRVMEESADAGEARVRWSQELAEYATATDLAALDRTLLERADATVDPLLRLHQTAFGEVPGSDELDGWVGVLTGNAGTDAPSSLATIAVEFTRTAEFQDRYGGRSEAEIIESFLENALDRAPSDEEVASWTARLEDDTLSLSQALLGIAQSDEVVGKSDFYVDNFLLRAAYGVQDYQGSLYDLA
jgi:metallo-beta-lactamase class B